MRDVPVFASIDKPSYRSGYATPRRRPNPTTPNAPTVVSYDDFVTRDSVATDAAPAGEDSVVMSFTESASRMEEETWRAQAAAEAAAEAAKTAPEVTWETFVVDGSSVPDVIIQEGFEAVDYECCQVTLENEDTDAKQAFEFYRRRHHGRPVSPTCFVAWFCLFDVARTTWESMYSYYRNLTLTKPKISLHYTPGSIECVVTKGTVYDGCDFRDIHMRRTTKEYNNLCFKMKDILQEKYLVSDDDTTTVFSSSKGRRRKDLDAILLQVRRLEFDDANNTRKISVLKEYVIQPISKTNIQMVYYKPLVYLEEETMPSTSDSIGVFIDNHNILQCLNHDVQVEHTYIMQARTFVPEAKLAKNQPYEVKYVYQKSEDVPNSYTVVEARIPNQEPFHRRGVRGEFEREVRLHLERKRDSLTRRVPDTLGDGPHDPSSTRAQSPQAQPPSPDPPPTLLRFMR